MVGAILLTLLAGQQPKIDFEVKATSLINALGKLSRVTGTTLKPEPAMAQEIVCVRVKGVQTQDLLNKIAEATRCEWREQDGAKILYRPAELTQKFKDDEYKARVAFYKRILEPKRKELEKLGTPYEQAQAFIAAMEKIEKQIEEHPMGVSLDGPRLASPASTLVLRLALALGPEALAKCPEGGTTTFANDPTRAELPLGLAAQGYVKDYLEAETKLRDLLPEKPSQFLHGVVDDIFKAARMDDGVGKVLFTVRPSGRFLSLGVNVYTEKGQMRDWGFTNSYQLGEDPWAKERTAAAGDKPVWVDLSPVSADYAESCEPQPEIARFPGERKIKPWSALSDTMKKVLQNPEEIDPLSLIPTEGCYAIAEDGPMVAYLSDNAENAGRKSVKDGRLNLARFRALLKDSGHAVLSKDGWTLVQPTSPLFVLRIRLPRPALGRFVRGTVSAGDIGLELYSRFHFEGGPLAGSLIGSLYRKTLTLYGLSEMPEIESHAHEVYATLGGLSQNQWQLLRRGEEIRIGQAPSAQKSAADAWMKNGAYYLRTDPEANVPDLFEQWTEYAPSGLPAQAMLSAADKNIHTFRTMTMIKYPDGSMREDSMDPGRGSDPAVIAKAYAKGGYYKSWEQCLGDMRKSKFQVMERTAFTVRLRLLPTHMIEETFYGPTDPKILKYDDWPEPMRREFEETFKREFKGNAGLLDWRLLD